MVEAMRRHLGLGLVAMLLSCAAFGTSGPFAKALMTADWSPGAVVLTRIAGAAARPAPVRPVEPARAVGTPCARELPLAAFYGTLAVAAAQLGYFQAVSRLTVGVALLIEYLGIILVVLWVWALTRRTPHRLTGVGIVLALVGLALVLDVTGQLSPDLLGVMWGLLAAVGLAGHYVLAARPTSLPAVAFAGLGLTAGALVLAVAGLVGVLPMEVGAADGRRRRGEHPRLGRRRRARARRRRARLRPRHPRRPPPRLDPRLVRRPHRGALRRALRVGPAR